MVDILLGWVQVTWHLDPRPLVMASSRMNWGTCKAQCNRRKQLRHEASSHSPFLHLGGFTTASLPADHDHLVLTDNLQDFILLLPGGELLTKLLWQQDMWIVKWDQQRTGQVESLTSIFLYFALLSLFSFSSSWSWWSTGPQSIPAAAVAPEAPVEDSSPASTCHIKEKAFHLQLTLDSKKLNLARGSTIEFITITNVERERLTHGKNSGSSCGINSRHSECWHILSPLAT